MTLIPDDLPREMTAGWGFRLANPTRHPNLPRKRRTPLRGMAFSRTESPRVFRRARYVSAPARTFVGQAVEPDVEQGGLALRLAGQGGTVEESEPNDQKNSHTRVGTSDEEEAARAIDRPTGQSYENPTPEEIKRTRTWTLTQGPRPLTVFSGFPKASLAA